MIYIGYFILFFGALRLLIALINFLSFPYLPNKAGSLPKELISILIPARNEESTIGNLLSDLVKFKQHNLEIIIYDDESTDKTIDIVNRFSTQNAFIHLISGVDLPKGWIGKNHANHKLAEAAKGDYLLFLDADVRIKPGLIERSVNYMIKKDLHLLSIFPKQIMLTKGEQISVPIMNWILLSLLPLFLIRISRKTSFSAANGQFMLFRADTYKKYLPHLKFQNDPVEDIAILRYFKHLRLKVGTLLGNKHIHCRMYGGSEEAIEGFAKNYLQFFGNSIIVAILFGILTSSAIIIVFLFNELQWSLIYLLIIITTRILVSLASKQSVVSNLILIVPQQMVLMKILIRAIIRRKNKSLIWKERKISGIY